MNIHSHENQKSYPWWNRPLWGNQSFLQWFIFLFKKLRRQEIPETAINLYKDSYIQVKNIGALIRTIDDLKFTSKEFIEFLKINRQFEQEKGVFENLKNSIELLRVALETKESFLKIEATETQYRSFSQQEFYDSVYELLELQLDVEEFKKRAQREATEIIPKIKSDEGKAAIQTYVNQLDIVCEDELGLKLLYFFKQYDLSSFSILRNVAEIADSFYDRNLDSLKEFKIVVQAQAELFFKLGEIIRVPKQRNIPETYAIILQYIALRNRHSTAFGQFKQLLNLLKQWQKFYKPMLSILEEYPPSDYKQPPLFKDPIPALEIYQKYGSHLD
jgi:hypothetical protein